MKSIHSFMAFHVLGYQFIKQALAQLFNNLSQTNLLQIICPLEYQSSRNKLFEKLTITGLILILSYLSFLVLLVAPSKATTLDSVATASVDFYENRVLQLTEQDNHIKLNINLANIEQLIALPGIGRIKAQAIIDYRNSVGQFNSITELQKIQGIGEKLYEKLSHLIEI